jgi:hypothetical protein
VYFALMFLSAIAIVILVLVLEHRGDPCLLERQYAEKRRAQKDCQ